MTRGHLSVVALCLLIKLISADYMVEIQFMQWTNADRTLSNGGYCDGNSFNDACETSFEICAFPGLTRTSCAIGQVQTEARGDQYIDFTGTNSLGNGVSNPLTLRYSGLNPTFGVQVNANDEDPFSKDLINTFTVSNLNVNDAVVNAGQTYSPVGAATGNKASLRFRIRAYCATNYYGSDCSVLCTPNDMYDCNTEGQIVCKNGNSPPSCLTRDQCSSYPCINGGTCNAIGSTSYTCTCQSGFTGPNCNLATDECSSRPCQNGATCVDKIRSYQCVCPPGVSGVNCEFSDPCGTAPCGAHGNCRVLGNSYYCECSTGWTGNNCESQISPCSSNPCNNNGQCAAFSGFYICTCTYPFTGPNCNIKKGCYLGPCQNGATCEDFEIFNPDVIPYPNYNCICPSGFAGVNCENSLNIDPCWSSPCLNNGACNRVSSTTYTCSCQSGFSGSRCETTLNICQVLSPCQNGGVCNYNPLVSQAYTCTCQSGFTGQNCESSIDPCSSSPCQRGTCYRSGTTFTCQCPSGWTGTFCQAQLFDACSSTPCQNGGSCHVSSTSNYYCQCAAGFTGPQCATSINSCNPNPCQNNGVCSSTPFNLFPYYQCTCQAGYTGYDCDQPIADGCSTSPCLNRGACIPSGTSSYSCICAFGFTGTNCETPIQSNPCATNPCLNFGTCSALSSTNYQCTCASGWTGTNCQTRTSGICSFNPCLNSGQCVALSTTQYQCNCLPGWVGTNCETSTTTGTPVGGCEDVFVSCGSVQHLPHPTDCTKFIHCAHGIPNCKLCPSGLHFNPTLEICDWPENAGCYSG